MSTGPALRQLHSHRSIHEGAYTEARDLTNVVDQLFTEHREEDCLQTVELLIEHWEERIIAHADAEDEGFYQELLKKHKNKQDQIYMLMRDHELFRIIIGDLKKELEETKKVTKQMIYQFHSLLVINHIHHKSEEKQLFLDDV